MKIEIQKSLLQFSLNNMKDKSMTTQKSKEFVMKLFDLSEVSDIEPTGTISVTFPFSDGKFFIDENMQQSVNISDKKLVNVVMTFLVMDLLKLNFYTSNIFNKCASQELINQYDEIRNSKFMKAMREKYMENDELKENLTYPQVMKEMLDLTKKDELKNTLTSEQITGWNKFCHFFAQIVKLIYKMLGQGEYKSTLDEKKAQNVKIETQRQLIETENAKIRQYNEEVGKWVKFAEEFKSDVEIGVGIK